MDKSRQAHARHAPELLVRDALRGFRYAVRRSTHLFANADQSTLPQPIGEITSRIAKKIDSVSQEAEYMSSSVIGGPLKKAALPDKAFFGQDGYDPNAADRAPREAAAALYFGLSWSARQLGCDDMLLSETICLECVERLGNNALQGSASEMADMLACDIIDRRAFRLFAPAAADPQSLRFRVTVGSAYTAALWFFAPRGIAAGSEEDLLDNCCAIIRDHLDRIIQIRTGSGSTERLFEELIDIV
ncbi:hypothetical protein [Hoeflea poritis]|uniref:Uncharacterized protein n=1 Tax=Hoeflea poritis TaxID=2993659 RepID=A0ABT4VVC6_9HYPH|nr:hypothetical protein [Hoeflea poritis]MDA4848676.1 hypothetical protein [Hoeflea poritis]